MSNVNINADVQAEDSSSEGSSVDIEVIPSNEKRVDTEASSSDSEPSCSSSERQRRCVIEMRVETQLSRNCSQAKGVAVRLLQSNLHRVRIYAPEDIEQEKDTLNLNEDSM